MAKCMWDIVKCAGAGRSMQTTILATVLAILQGLANSEALQGTGKSHERPVAGGGHEGVERRWFWGVGVSNFHPRLDESEGLIDQQINGPFGALLPRWERPETFKDWSHDWKIWDSWLIFGRDLGKKTSWFVSFGGTAASIANGRTYFPLGLPLKVDVDFSRTEVFLDGGMTYYPWAKPSRADSQREPNVLKRAISGGRPFFELGLGYAYMHAAGDVQVRLPLAGQVYHRKETDDYHLLQASPRAGIEFPLTHKDSLSVMASYFFFVPHETEFNSGSCLFTFKHRF